MKLSALLVLLALTSAAILDAAEPSALGTPAAALRPRPLAEPGNRLGRQARGQLVDHEARAAPRRAASSGQGVGIGWSA